MLEKSSEGACCHMMRVVRYCIACSPDTRIPPYSVPQQRSPELLHVVADFVSVTRRLCSVVVIFVLGTFVEDCSSLPLIRENIVQHTLCTRRREAILTLSPQSQSDAFSPHSLPITIEATLLLIGFVPLPPPQCIIQFFFL